MHATNDDDDAPAGRDTPTRMGGAPDAMPDEPDPAATFATDLIFLRDAYLRETEATVLAVEPATRGVVLDRTVFYAGGGGQPADTGTLTRPANGETWHVESVNKKEAAVHHLLSGDGPLPEVGETLLAAIDWEPRYRLMRTHTALHALCGTIFRDYGALVTGGNMGPEKARMDFEMEEFTPERVAEIEQRVNAELATAREVRVRTLPRDEAFAIPDLIRTKINLLPEGIREVRTVEIVGLDLQADGGTHVANTREVGGIRVVGTRSKGKSNKRLEIVLSGMAGDEASGGSA